MTQNSYLNTLLAMDDPPLERVLMCTEVQAFFRMNVQSVVSFFKKTETIKKMYTLLETSKDFQIITKILALHRSPNKAIVREISKNQELLTMLCKILENKAEVSRYVFGAVASILQICFDNWTKETFSLFNETLNNYMRLIKVSHLPGVFACLNKFATSPESNISGKPFIWMLFLALIDSHGPGCRVPPYVTQCKCYNSSMGRLEIAQRCRVLQLMNAYFSVNSIEFSEIFKAVSTALPLLLQDASNDYEISLVFKLGLRLDYNSAMSLSAMSVINCYKSSDILIQFSLMYMTEFDVNVSYRSIELFIYRMLEKKRYNNFVTVALANLVQALVNEKKDKSFIENVREIVCQFCENGETCAIRAFRTAMFMATEGLDPMKEDSCTVADEVDQMMSYVIVHDKLIQKLQAKAKEIDSNEIYTPIFDVKGLWKKEEIAKMEKLYKTISKLRFKNVTRRPSYLPPKTTKFDIKTSGNDFKSDGDIELEEIEISPKSKKSSTTFRSDDEDDDIIQLKEIDVTDPVPFSRNYFPPSPGRPISTELDDNDPLTTLELMKEPIPLTQLPNDVKPIPKSPRKRRESLNDDDEDEAKKTSSDNFVELDSAKDLEELQLNDEDDISNIDQVRDMIFKQLSGKNATRDTKPVKKTSPSEAEAEKPHTNDPVSPPAAKKGPCGNCKIENVVTDMYIENPGERKKPVLNRKVLVVEVFEKTTKLKLCMLDTFENLGRPSKRDNADTEQTKTVRKHKHRSIPKPDSSPK